MEAQSCEGWETWGLIEQIEVVEGELLSDGFFHFDESLIFLSVAVVGSQLDETGSCGSLDWELNVVGLGRDGEWLTKGLKLFADFGELVGVDGDQGTVLGVWDRKMLNIKGNEIESELGGSLSFWVVESDLEGWWVLVGWESDRVSWVSELHHLGEVVDVDSKNDILIASVGLKSLHAQIQGNEGNMGGVHGLQRKA